MPSVDSLLETLRKSTDSEERAAASAHLLHAQQSDPSAFLECTWATVSSASVPPETRFFVAAAVADFVEQSWHNAVPRELQYSTLDRYTALLLREPLPSLALARKVSSVLSLMARRGGAKAPAGGLPPAVERVAAQLTDALLRGAEGGTPPPAQCVLALHVFLKTSEKRRVGGVFPRLCAAMVPTMSALFTGSAEWGRRPDGYVSLLYLFKCALRVFGYGVFDPLFYRYVLDAAWRLAQETAAAADGEDLTNAERMAAQRGRQRLLEYAVKVQRAMMDTFPERLHELSVGFFVLPLSPSLSGEDTSSLFALLEAMLCSSIGPIATSKMVCRAMRIFVDIFTLEDSHAFAAECVAVWVSRPAALRRVICRVMEFLADDVSAAAAAEWDAELERVAAELDGDAGDDSHTAGGAEQLLLALTGSTRHAAAGLAAAWDVVGELLATGDAARVTAALHAIGVCYSTMSLGQDPANYLGFLGDRLLPLMSSGTAEPFVLRRVVWLVGMWCESVGDVAMRRVVHEALRPLLAEPTHAVVRLTALHTIADFISDANFTPEEVTPAYMQDILASVRGALAVLRSPSALRDVAQLVHAIAARNLLPDGALLDLFLPATRHLLAAVESAEDDSVNLGAIGMLLECLGSCARAAGPSETERVWSLFAAVVAPCTTAGSVLELCAEDYAWELLLHMSRATHQWCSAANAGLDWAISAMARDFGLLHLAVRSAAALLLLCPDSAAACTIGVVERALDAMTTTPSHELGSAFFALLAVLERCGGPTLRGVLIAQCTQRCLSSEDVQADSYSVRLALLIAWGLPPFCPTDDGMTALTQAVHQHMNGATLAERVALLVDVSPNRLATECFVGLLRLLAERSPLLSAEDARMIQHVMESAQRTHTEDEGAEEELRNPMEMLLELLGEEQVPAGSPHLARIAILFGIPLT